MNSFVLEEAKRCQDEVNRRYDPTIRVVWSPKIHRFVLCEDKMETRDSVAPDGVSQSPWVPRDSDLEGASYIGPWGPQMIGEQTTIQALRRLETRDGDYIAPDADIAIMILAMECPKAGDKDPTQFGMKAVQKREDAARARWRSDIKDAMPTILAARRNRVYSTPSYGWKDKR